MAVEPAAAHQLRDLGRGFVVRGCGDAAAGRKLHTKAGGAVATAEREFPGPLSAADRKELRALLIDVMQHRLPWMAKTED